MWLLYISCAQVAEVLLGSKVNLPLLILSLGLIRLVRSEHSKTGAPVHSSHAQEYPLCPYSGCHVFLRK
jgi:hypothetical protein